MGLIDYQTEKYQFSCDGETPRLTRQWADVLEECRHLKAGAAERLRIALLNVDYVTRFGLPFRLLLIRTPQLNAGLRDELRLNQKDALFSGSALAASGVCAPISVRYLTSFSAAWSPASGIWIPLV